MCVAQPLRIDKNGGCLFCAKLPTAQSNRNSIRRQFFIFFSMAQFMRRRKSDGKSSKCWSSASRRLGVCCAAAVSVRCCTNLPLAMLQVSGTKSQSQDARHGIQLLLKMSHPPTVKRPIAGLLTIHRWALVLPGAKQQERTAGPGKAVKNSGWPYPATAVFHHI